MYSISTLRGETSSRRLSRGRFLSLLTILSQRWSVGTLLFTRVTRTSTPSTRDVDFTTNWTNNTTHKRSSDNKHKRDTNFSELTGMPNDEFGQQKENTISQTNSTSDEVMVVPDSGATKTPMKHSNEFVKLNLTKRKFEPDEIADRLRVTGDGIVKHRNQNSFTIRSHAYWVPGLQEETHPYIPQNLFAASTIRSYGIFPANRRLDETYAQSVYARLNKYNDKPGLMDTKLTHVMTILYDERTDLPMFHIRCTPSTHVFRHRFKDVMAKADIPRPFLSHMIQGYLQNSSKAMQEDLKGAEMTPHFDCRINIIGRTLLSLRKHRGNEHLKQFRRKNKELNNSGLFLQPNLVGKTGTTGTKDNRQNRQNMQNWQNRQNWQHKQNSTAENTVAGEHKRRSQHPFTYI